MNYAELRLTSRQIINSGRHLYNTNVEFQRAVNAGAVAAGAYTTRQTWRVIRYKNPNVRAARAVRRMRSGSRQAKRMGTKPGMRVRYTSARAGSLRSRSDRLYNRAGAAENKLGRYVGKRKPRGQARLRVASVAMPNGKLSSKAGFYAKTSYAPSAARGLKTGARAIGKTPRPGSVQLAIKAGVYRGRSDRARYRANAATVRQRQAISRRAHRTRRDSKGRFAGSY